MQVIILLLLTVYLISNSESARILAVFPTPAISHQIVFRSLTQALVQRGHEVVVITPDPAFPKGQTPANLTEIDVHEVTYMTWRKGLQTNSGRIKDAYSGMKVGMELFTSIFEQQLLSEEVKKIINDKKVKFDLLLLEACVRTALVFSHVFKAPVIQVSSLGDPIDLLNVIGASFHPLLYPTPMQQNLYNLTLWQKIKELYSFYWMQDALRTCKNTETEMIRKHFGGNTPSVDELSKNVDMLFLNVHPIWDHNRPVPPNVIYMGGVHLKPQNELPKDLKTFLDSSKNGVIYTSFGTSATPSMMPANKIQLLIKALSRLPYDILFKWESKELPGQTSNIRVEKWLPQSDLLKHPKIKLFITQGGLQSTEEAIVAGVPLIGIPLLGDQWYNAAHYNNHGFGMRLDMETLTEEKLIDAVNVVINEKSYRQNIVKLRELMYDQPQKPLNRAMWWIEHVLRHGGARHLRTPAANMPWTEYYEIELIVIILVGLLLTIVLLSFVIYLFLNICKYCINLSKYKKD